MLHQLLERQKQAVLPSQLRRLSATLTGVFGWRPSILVLPRGDVHRMRLEVRGIPSRFVLSSLRLQLRQTLGTERFGFACSVADEVATLWYWSEDEGSALNRLLAGKANGGDYAPWPEPLLRQPVENGVHLIRCQGGFEAVSVKSSETVRTRWFPTLPTVEAWGAFVRDAGLASHDWPLPLPREMGLQLKQPRGWRLSTSLIQPIPWSGWVGVATVALGGMLVVVAGVYDMKLGRAISAERASYQQLVKENAVTIDLQNKINQKVDYLEGFRGIRASFPQLELMRALLESGFFEAESKISLAEWECRNNRLRLLFSVPQEDFSLSQFLAVLERQPIFRDIKLMSDTPQGTVGVQIAIASPVVPAESASDSRQDKISTAVSVPDGRSQ